MTDQFHRLLMRVQKPARYVGGEYNQIIKNKNGYSMITDTSGKLLAKVSAPGRYGISFAYVEPKTTDDSPLRYAIKEGKVIFEYTSENGRLQFIKNYNKAVSDAKNA